MYVFDVKKSRTKNWYLSEIKPNHMKKKSLSTNIVPVFSYGIKLEFWKWNSFAEHILIDITPKQIKKTRKSSTQYQKILKMFML